MTDLPGDLVWQYGAHSLFLQEEAALLLTEDGIVESVNPPFEKLWGVPASELAGLSVDSLDDQTRLPASVSCSLAYIYRELQNGFPSLSPSPSRLASKGERVFYLKARRNGGPAAFRGFRIQVDDITDAYEIHYLDESSHHSRWQELEAENRELEAFAYSVAHDLRAPLRFIGKFAHLLMEQHGEELSHQALQYAEHIREGTRQMAQLIEDLLEFSQVIGQAIEREPVDMTVVASEAYEELSEERDARKVELLLGKLDPAYADPALLRQVFLNLIGNALKFTRNREVARIEIYTFLQDGDVVYGIRDNGAGFDAEFNDRLFKVFNRFHQPDEFEGRGIGLALVRRIVERHGGRIWAESQVDAGATFYFTLAPE